MDIKKCWYEASFLPVGDGNRNKKQTALESLIERYKRFSRLGLILAFVTPMNLFFILIRQTNIGVIATVLFTIFGILFFLLASFMDRWLALGISQIDLSEMSVSDVCRMAFYYRKKHFQCIAILLPLAIIYIGLMAWAFSSQEYTLYGIAIGAVVGLLIGSLQLRKFLDEYRGITE